MALEPALLTDMFDAAAKGYGDQACTYFMGRTLTYGEIAEQVARAAKGLQGMGVRNGTRVGLLLPNTPSFIVYYFAVLKAGGTVVNFNPLYSVEEIAFQIRDSGTEIMVTLDLSLTFQKVEAVLESGVLDRAIVASFASLLPKLKSAVLRFSPGSRLAKVATSPQREKVVLEQTLLDNDGRYDAPALSPSDIAVLQYTGGTTGTPKGAVLTHGNLTVNIKQVKAWWVASSRDSNRILGVLPFFHVFAMTTVMNFGVHEGMEIILVPRFELIGTLKLIDKLKPSMMPGVPTLFGAMVRYPGIKKFNLTSLQFCISGGAALPLETKKGFESIAGCHLVEGYGLSETAPVATCNPMDRAPREGSIGLPLPGTEVSIRSLDDPATEMPLGERGEICIAGPQVMSGYWNREAETAQAFTGRFFRTGDVGYMDDEGYIFIVDRMKDMINCSGFNVYPRRIEDALYEHPAVEEVTVIGIPDTYRGEAPKAFVKLKEGMEADKTALIAHLREKLSKIEIPAEIEFRDALPKTMIGKLSKKELVEEERKRARRDA
ncbi:Long-chain-fatty-acid--CoA ligase [Methyloligella halotolerans]|uniref:Long-chain-fatty-acid--CoA ligase n=1 Tax=Methyloligella halotolerans TaxID=1177755 RepID=A0A1E2S3F1_9HYPH|nr:long-chain fatty acid--CoA ligase [Methyloligella halotolerans]ODA68858.1 Long-chain-fatty-acid--CoA ligase [Methyloligella halotolerans]